MPQSHRVRRAWFTASLKLISAVAIALLSDEPASAQSREAPPPIVQTLSASPDESRELIGLSMTLAKYRDGAEFDAATEFLREHIRSRPNSSHVARVEYWIGDNYYFQGDYPAAINAFER